MEIRQVRPDRPADFRAWFDAADIALAAGRADPEAVTYDQMARVVGEPRSSERFEAFGAFRDDECVGAASLVLPLLENKQLALIFIGVPPDHRGQGVGTALLEHLGELATAAERNRWYTKVRVPAGDGESADSRFVVRHGFTLRNTEIRRQAKLPLPTERIAELEAYAAERADGYQVVSWVGACPEEYIEQYAHMRGLISTDAPTGDLDHEAERWDADRQREDDRRTAKSGRIVYVSAAVAPDGTLAGHTRIYFDPSAPDRAQQGGTLVLKAHRGHRLGLAMKLANLSALQVAEPAVNRIDTENAEQNAPMVAVNIQLGFEVIERLEEYQRDL